MHGPGGHGRTAAQMARKAAGQSCCGSDTMSLGNGYRRYSRLTTGSQAWYSWTTASMPRRFRWRAHGLFSTKARFREDHGSPRVRWVRAIAAAMSVGRR